MIDAALARKTKIGIAIGVMLTVGLIVFATNSNPRVAKSDVAQLSSACTYLSIAADSPVFLPKDGNMYEHLLDGVKELEAFGQSYPEYEFLYTSADAALSTIASHMPDFEPNDPRYAVAMTDLFNSKSSVLRDIRSQCLSVLSMVSGHPTTDANYSTNDPFWNSNN